MAVEVIILDLFVTADVVVVLVTIIVVLSRRIRRHRCRRGVVRGVVVVVLSPSMYSSHC